ncbi:MAG: dihydroneopterin aldolase [Kiritimatiellia bacterium]
MKTKPYDKIHIKDLLVRCIIGIREWERTNPQNVNISLTLYTDFAEACHTDDISDTVDYADIKKEIMTKVEKSSFRLIESLAQMTADICLRNKRVARVDVSLSKPGALRFAKDVAVEITRCQN